MALAMMVLLEAGASAGDYPLSGAFLHMASEGTAGRMAMRFGATGDALPDDASSVDPTVTGAVLEVLGGGVHGDAASIPLPGDMWRPLGDPPGSRGFRYFDASPRFGVRKLSLRFGTRTSLLISGAGKGWPYRTSGVPHAVMVRLHMGDAVFCASFGTFKRGRGGAMCAPQNPPPAICNYTY